jgi:hypothetical protein
MPAGGALRNPAAGGCEKARLFHIPLLLAAACSGAPAKEAEPPPPGSAPLSVPTEVKARRVRLVLSDRFRKEARIEGIRVEETEGGKVVARGAARLRLRKLDIEALEEIEAVFLPDHGSFLLYATGVESFRQQKNYSHRTEKVTAVTIADDKVTILP